MRLMLNIMYTYILVMSLMEEAISHRFDINLIWNRLNQVKNTSDINKIATFLIVKYVTIHHETSVKSPVGHFQFMSYPKSTCPKL